jgi:choline dehydrogenase-like flavoprotein
MGSSSPEYDFIVVGAGPAGCSVARGLATTLSKPAVCLVEAGGPNDDTDQRMIGNLFVQMMNSSQINPYESVPQERLAERKVNLTRGKGLGGSPAVNFTA